ncbi:hypothetical protein Tco_0066199 [Tanacetum coccineum]
MELVQGATPICEGSCRLTSLERQEVWNDYRSCKVRVGSNGNLLWEASVLLGRKKGATHWRDVRTLDIGEAYTTKYSIHPGVDTMLCGFRLTNRWLSMKKDIASCGSKYLAYSEEEVEYQGSSGLLLQPELWVVEGLTLERYSTFGKKDKLEPSYVGPFEILWKIKESLNVTFNETPPPSKTSPLVDDDLDEEEAIREIKKKNLENVVEDETLEIDEIVNIKGESREPKNVNEALGRMNVGSAMQEELISIHC